NRSCLESFRSAGVREVLYLFITAVFILTILGNLVIIISTSYFKQLHFPTSFLILSMAGTDFLLGFAIMPYSMVRSVEKCWFFGIIFCKVHYSFDLMLCLSSIFHLCSIAVDWFYAICHSLHYTSTMTVTAIKQIVAACWSVPAAFALVFSEVYASGIEGYEKLVKCLSSCPIAFNKLWGAFLFTVGFFAPACVMIGISVKIFAVSQRMINNMRKSTGSQLHKGASKNERKAAKTLGVDVGVHVLCLLPFSIDTIADRLLDFITPPALFFPNLVCFLQFGLQSCILRIYVFSYHCFRKAVKL
ncbi:TAAR2 protein, partial [Neopipo cinnamomea]|nr:TAAR2 protein [Neopipo cinnamomea]